MRNDSKKRPRPRRPRSQAIPSRDLFHQTLTDYSDEETQGVFEFMRKLKQADDKTRVFNRFCFAIQCYRDGYTTYITLEKHLLWILRDHKGLLEEFHQLKSGFASRVIRNNEKKENAESNVQRKVELLKKTEALGESAYKAFIIASAFSADIETLSDHTSLKEEVEKFLVASRLLKRKREESVEVTPSYQIRPEAEVGSSSNEVSNEKMNNLEDKLMKEDMLMRDLAAVIRFGKDALKDPKLSEKPPLGFNSVLDWFCGGKEVPQKYKTHPKLTATYLLPIMQTTLEEMTRAKTVRAISVYKRAS